MANKEIPFQPIILFPLELKAEKVDVSSRGLKDKSFKFGHQTYRIRDYAKFLWKKWRHKEFRSYYRAGDPEPIAWTPPSSKGFSAEDLFTMEVEDITVKGISKALLGARRRKKMGSLKWIVILMFVLGGGAALVMLAPTLLKFLGM